MHNHMEVSQLTEQMEREVPPLWFWGLLGLPFITNWIVGRGHEKEEISFIRAHCLIITCMTHLSHKGILIIQ